ncbi:MAG: carbon storage regulator [Candidatus Brocadiales bacterium]|nr:carbon storage regulator [Candidatus Brocadiales bacterium]
MLTLTRKPGESMKIGDGGSNFLNIITIVLLSINLSIAGYAFG